MGLDRIHRALNDAVRRGGGRIDGVFFCPHDADAHRVPGCTPREELVRPCRCRKPAPGLILEAAQVHDVDLHRSFMVCRNVTDVRAARAVALETILLTDVRVADIEVPPDLRPHHAVATLSDVIKTIDGAREAAFHS